MIKHWRSLPLEERRRRHLDIPHHVANSMAMEGGQWVRPGFGNGLVPKIRERLIRLAASPSPSQPGDGFRLTSNAYRCWLLVCLSLTP